MQERGNFTTVIYDWTLLSKKRIKQFGFFFEICNKSIFVKYWWNTGYFLLLWIYYLQITQNIVFSALKPIPWSSVIDKAAKTELRTAIRTWTLSQVHNSSSFNYKLLKAPFFLLTKLSATVFILAYLSTYGPLATVPSTVSS